MWSDVIELEFIKSSEIDDIGDIINNQVSFQSIYANKKSITQSEFYQANAQGFKPELKFEINAFEYENNKRVKYKGKIYKVHRIYEVSPLKMEIICVGDVNNGTT